MVYEYGEFTQGQVADIKHLLQKKIFFLPYKASMWDSLESVWKAAVEDKEHCEAYVVPIPYYDIDSDELGYFWLDKYISSSFSYCKDTNASI